MITIQDLFEKALTTPSDIRLDLPMLHDVAKRCPHITEFGTGFGNSTIAMLAANPKTLITYDLRFLESASALKKLSVDTDFRMVQANVLEVEIEPTDLLFIDSLHTYVQLSAELRKHGDKARRYLAFHDTEVFGMESEDKTRPGLRMAIKEFVADRPHWKLYYHSNIHNGFTVLERT